jgi:hypothetical protein
MTLLPAYEISGHQRKNAHCDRDFNSESCFRALRPCRRCGLERQRHPDRFYSRLLKRFAGIRVLEVVLWQELKLAEPAEHANPSRLASVV